MMKYILNNFLQKKKGFTLVELMVVIVIMGIVGTVAIPTFQKMNERAIFDKEVQSTISAIDDMRNNALTNKKCPNDKPSKYWEVSFDKTNSKFITKCIDTSTPVVVESIIEDVTFDLTTFGSIKTAALAPPGAEVDTALLQFYTQEKSIDIQGDTSTDQQSIHIILDQGGTLSGEKKVCLDRVKGFITLDADCP